LTIDLEDWYHPEYLRRLNVKESEGRFIQTLDKTLTLLSKCGVNATFFVVGELIEKYPELLEEIADGGHEIAFHGYDHRPLWELNAEVLGLGLDRFNSFGKMKCQGFRAPSFSLDNRTKWALEVLKRSGISYDSSIFPMRTPLYGVPGAPQVPYRISCEDVSREDLTSGLLEFPLLVYQVLGIRIPAAGGFYLRALPIDLMKVAIRKMNKRGAPAVIFVHSWEIDPGTTRLKLGVLKSFVTYHGINQTEKKLESVLAGFQFTSFRDHLQDYGP
jgi:polysaccharide deacetylase family protein (PEP-CTERM system associated)